MSFPGLGRHELTTEARGQLLGESPPTNTQVDPQSPSASIQDEIAKNPQSKKDELLAKIMGRNLNFVSTDTKTSEIIDMTKSQGPETVKIINMTTKKEENTPDFISIKDSGKDLVNVFKPFVTNPKKQARYEMYCEKGEVERDSDMERLSEWEREREMVEFEQAAKLYRPLTGIMGDR